jgi:hypothetical protein
MSVHPLTYAWGGRAEDGGGVHQLVNLRPHLHLQLQGLRYTLLDGIVEFVSEYAGEQLKQDWKHQGKELKLLVMYFTTWMYFNSWLPGRTFLFDVSNMYLASWTKMFKLPKLTCLYDYVLVYREVLGWLKFPLTTGYTVLPRPNILGYQDVLRHLDFFSYLNVLYLASLTTFSTWMYFHCLDIFSYLDVIS